MNPIEAIGPVETVEDVWGPEGTVADPPVHEVRCSMERLEFEHTGGMTDGHEGVSPARRLEV